VENFKTNEVLAVLLKHKKPIIIACTIATAVSVVISFLIAPKFKSYAIVYPVNLSASSEESNTEQLLQFMYSEEVKNAVAEKFNLYEHYEIDKNKKSAKAAFDLIYKSNISMDPTLFESIEIEVIDESPELARDVAQGIIDATNTHIMSIKKERLGEYILNNERELAKHARRVDSLKGMINDVRKEYNIVDFRYQSKYLTKDLHSGKTLSPENAKTLEGLKTQESELTRLGSVYGTQIGTYNYFRNEIDKYFLDYDSKISFMNVVSKPTLPDKKISPVRWLIVALSTGAVFILSCVYFALTNSTNRKVD
jgi:uncharacterized protein involved in exopolysaccharide biosynthesis